jgi:putative transposase
MITQAPMKRKPTQYPARKRARLSTFNYSNGGYYFVTICAHERKCLFGEIIDGVMLPNSCGQMVTSVWMEIPQRFNQAILDSFIVMPNHIHGILVLETGLSLSRVIQVFKSICTNEYIRGVQKQRWEKFDQSIWQKSFYDHVIRNDQDLLRIQEYIVNNPLQWAMDEEHPNHQYTLDKRSG